jgi:hypothetical protein
LVENEITLENVVYICYGIEIGSGVNGWSSIENFAIFSAAKFDKFTQQNTGKELERSSANDMHVFFTGMLDGNFITYD